MLFFVSTEMAEAEENRVDGMKHQPLKFEQNEDHRTKHQPTGSEEIQDQLYNQPLKFEQNLDQRQTCIPLKSEQREKLEEFFQNIILKAPVDFTKEELHDIQHAVYTMLERIQTRVNSRGIFYIVRILPSGSMTEKTSLWKHDYFGKQYIEFDFLALLEKAIKQCEDQTARNNCQGCITMLNPPVNLKRLRQCYNKDDVFNAETIKNKRMISKLFLNEINYCLTLSCDCLSLDIGFFELSFQRSVEHGHGCGTCTVDMPTGTLSVNTETMIDKDFTGLAKCSLVFLWTSKAKSLSAPDKWLLQEPQPISSLPIEVDFLPALGSLKASAPGGGYEHDYFIVPKHCNLCDCDVNAPKWRKSWCVAEINVFITEMTDKHRKCYQILKYLSERLSYMFCSLSNYHVKTVVLEHHITCSNTTDDYVECVIGIYQELLQAYRSKQLLSYQSNINIIEQSDLSKAEDLCMRLLNKLCSVCRTDSWEDFVYEGMDSD